MANSIGWGAAVSNLIGYGKANEEGDNFKDESSTFLLETESDEFLLTQSASVDLAGWGEVYDTTWWGDTIDER